MIDKLGAENIRQWHFYDDSNCKQFIDVNLSLKLSDLPICGSIFHYKTRGFMYNFIKYSHTVVFERNVATGKTRTLNLNSNYNTTTTGKNKNNNSKNVTNGDKTNQYYMNNNANCNNNLSNHINNNNKQKTSKNQVLHSHLSSFFFLSFFFLFLFFLFLIDHFRVCFVFRVKSL